MYLGSAYVYGSYDNGVTWSEQQQLAAFNGAIGEWFGESVALYGHTIVVGARFEDNIHGTDAGEEVKPFIKA